VKVTAEAARRFLVAHHMLAPARSLEGGPDAVLEVVRRFGSIQFDPLAVAGRNHDLVLHARVADYEPAWCDLLYERREVFDPELTMHKTRAPKDHGSSSPLLLSVCVGFGQNRRRVLGVRFVDEETRAAREVERVGADLDHRRYSAGTASGFPALSTAATSTSVVGVRVSTSISRKPGARQSTSRSSG
jgi:hypothetical protein